MNGSLLALLIAAVLPAVGTYTVEPARSSVRYGVVHKLHQVEGASSDLEGKAVVREDGSAIAQVRVPVSTFRSGDANRDTHMLEVVQAGRFPFVTVKAVLRMGTGGEFPVGPVPAEAELDFHGVKSRATIPIRLTRQADGTLRVQGGFDVSLDAHGVERPSLLFVKVDDACHIDVDLVLRGEAR
jgi:polyisoprenoid-binding protein YceI